jgi:uncharacterized protein
MERLEIDEGVILRESDNLAFFAPDSMRLFALTIPQTIPLDSVARWLATKLDDTLERRPDPGSDGGEPQDALHLSRRQALLPLIVGHEELSRAGVKGSLGRLTLNISNACNLWCSYCYADHGHYHAPKSFMSVEQVNSILAKLALLYDAVSVVQFFGGEPLLNLSAIQAAGEAFEAAAQGGSTRRVPKFVATTNGTLSTPQILETLRRWEMELTISWDGPKEVHDGSRPMLGNGSSYERIVETIARLRDLEIPYDIECTYNRRHLAAGVSVTDLMDFFHEATGQRVFHIAPVSLPAPRRNQATVSLQMVFRGEAVSQQEQDYIPVEELIPLYREATRYTVRNLFASRGPLLAMANGIVEQIANRKPNPTYCPAFFHQLSIATDGSVYPCFMFIGDPKFRLGNILTDEFPTQDSTALFRRYFEEFGFAPTGSRAWYAPLLSGCVAGEYISSGTMSARVLAPLYEAMIEECLLGVAVNLSEGALLPAQWESVRQC